MYTFFEIADNYYAPSAENCGMAQRVQYFLQEAEYVQVHHFTVKI